MQVVETTRINVTFSPLLKRYTLEEFWALPEPEDRSHYELVERVLYIAPHPKNIHDELVAFLSESLTVYIVSKDRPGRVFHPRASIYVEDICRTSADIVFEFLSESTGVYDRTTKADTYLALGVKEMWLIDSDNETVEVRNADSREGLLFWQRKIYSKGEQAESEVLKNWKIPVSELFGK
jgi:Uma2 family endonuclease